jgi:hypothetical protein
MQQNAAVPRQNLLYLGIIGRFLFLPLQRGPLNQEFSLGTIEHQGIFRPWRDDLLNVRTFNPGTDRHVAP